MIEGMDKLLNKLDRLANLSLEQSVEQATKLVQKDAMNLCRARSGELRNSIMTDMNNTEGHMVGIVYTNKKYGPYVEFGTGPKGQKNHKGISPNIPVTYHQTPWWIHEDQFDEHDKENSKKIAKEAAEKYHWFSVTTNEGTFYQVTGQPARPFMYPALKNNEEKIKKLIAGEVKEALK